MKGVNMDSLRCKQCKFNKQSIPSHKDSHRKSVAIGVFADISLLIQASWQTRAIQSVPSTAITEFSLQNPDDALNVSEKARLCTEQTTNLHGSPHFHAHRVCTKDSESQQKSCWFSKSCNGTTKGLIAAKRTLSDNLEMVSTHPVFRLMVPEVFIPTPKLSHWRLVPPSSSKCFQQLFELAAISFRSTLCEFSLCLCQTADSVAVCFIQNQAWARTRTNCDGNSCIKREFTFCMIATELRGP